MLAGILELLLISVSYLACKALYVLKAILNLKGYCVLSAYQNRVSMAFLRSYREDGCEDP